MKLVGLISGGKDSLFNMLQCIAAGHQMVAVANIEPDVKGEINSYMYQSVGHEAVSLIAAALGLPIFRQKTKGKAICKRKTYVGTSEDEVEDLFELLMKVMNKVNVEGVSVGAIASDYQRTRVENVCSRLGLKCFAYLWKRNQAELLQEMIDAELDAIIVKVACIGLHPDLHLGMHIKDIQPYLIELNKKFGVNICGEGGEYETLTLDCPLFHRFITIKDTEKLVLSDDAFAPVGFLSVKNASLELKSLESDDPIQILHKKEKLIQSIIKNPYNYVQDCVDEVSQILFPQKHQKQVTQDLPFPFEVDENQSEEPGMSLEEYWKKSSSSKTASNLQINSSKLNFLPDTTNCNLNYSSGWCCIGNVTGSTLMNAMQCLQKYLERINYEFECIVFVNLFIRDMSEFVSMNKVYSQFMPEVLPPARVCVQTDLPPEIGVIMMVIAHKLILKSQKVISQTNVLEKDAMHVQSISHWAPANIGPYSQCIRIGGIYYLAGQIPLIPGTMEILNKPIFHQCRLTLRHVLRVLQAMNENLNFSNVLQAICYVTSSEIARDVLALWSYITKIKHTVVTVIVISKLPKNAQLEWEVLACSFESPQVNEEVEIVEDYNLQMKRCVYNEPFTSSLICNISFLKKGHKKTLKLVTPTGLEKAIRNCIRFMRTDFKTVGTPLCILRIFYKGSESSAAVNINEIVTSFSEFKVVMTAIPVLGFEDPDVFLTITGVCH